MISKSAKLGMEFSYQQPIYDIPICAVCSSLMISDLITLSPCGHVLHKQCFTNINYLKKAPCLICEQQVKSCIELKYKFEEYFIRNPEQLVLWKITQDQLQTNIAYRTLELCKNYEHCYSDNLLFRQQIINFGKIITNLEQEIKKLQSIQKQLKIQNKKIFQQKQQIFQQIENESSQEIERILKIEKQFQQIYPQCKFDFIQGHLIYVNNNQSNEIKQCIYILLDYISWSFTKRWNIQYNDNQYNNNDSITFELDDLITII